MRTVLALVLFTTGASALAFDAPPTLVTGKIENGNLTIKVIRNVPQVREIVAKEVVNGKEVDVKRTVQFLVPVEETISTSLKDAKASRGGKALTERQLAKALAEETTFVTSVGPLATKYKALFKDDVILIEYPAPKK